MARKPNATGDRTPPKRKMVQAEQSALFIETARKLGVNEIGAKFERAFDKVASPSASTRATATPKRS